MVAAGKFREDLYYRLNVINLAMPALRERSSDVPLLAVHFLHKYTAENDKTIGGFSVEAMERLASYHWPGNVRELENVIERGVVVANGPEITLADLPHNLVPAKDRRAVEIPGATMEEIERYAITKTLEATGGATGAAAEILNISVRKINYKLQDYQSATKSAVDPSLAAILSQSRRRLRRTEE
jgi:two-component system response regulator HydG